MRIIVLATFIVFIFVSTCGINACNKATKKAEVPFYSFVTRQADTIITQLKILDSLVNNNSTVPVLQKQFALCRFAYKKTEGIIEYFFQGLTKRINGPALPDVKTDDNQVWPPHGFQVLEQYFFSDYNNSLANTVSNEVKILLTDFYFIKTNLAATTILPRYFAEIIQHQIIRIAALGVTGADAPLSKLSLQEAIYALKGLKEMVLFNKAADKIFYFDSAIKYLQTNTDFDTFDRLKFLQQYLMPLSEQHFAANKNILLNDSFPKPYRGSLNDIMKGKTFNADYFTSYAVSHSNQHKINLGKKLFFEKQLSKSNTISCASCHKPDLYFTDGLIKANNFVHGGNLVRNTPSIYYASLQNNQFYDMRSNLLEDQVNEVITNSSEFNFSSWGIAKKIVHNKDYKNLFALAFPTADSITGFKVRNAIATFIRSLNSFSSNFDDYMNGDTAALDEKAKDGFNLFAGKAKCATCHFIPLFNGTIPPWYNKSESEIIGVPLLVSWQNAVIDNDFGRYNFNKVEELKYAFKTPTLRNAAKTAPYMHNGVYKTLDEVVEFYHKGGGVGIGIKLPFQSLPFDSLQLNTAEKKSIVSFMQSLTDKKIPY
jgi:cytochrome c peroxidase